MTRFTFRGDATWGSGANPRLVAIMTENEAGFDAYAEKAGEAASDARKLLRGALSALSGRPGKDVVRYAHRYFLTGADRLDRQDLARIKSVITLTNNGLHGSTVALKVTKTMIDEQTGGVMAGEVVARSRGGVPSPATKFYHNVATVPGGRQLRMGAIHLSGDRLDAGRLGVKTLVHEATHKYAGTTDYCYFQDDGLTPATAFTSKEHALCNADSYAWFVLKVGRGWGLTMNNDMFAD